MRRLAILLWVGLAIVAQASPEQSQALRVLSAAPAGAIEQLNEASEIRVIFSEPMVPLGRVPANPDVPWATITPAIKGNFRWSGTTILIFTPDPATPLPYATKYTMTLAASAKSAAGQTLGTPFTLTWTTPTVKVMSARWYRKTGKVDSPVMLALSFNQPVRGADILAHVRVRQVPHDWTDGSSFSDAARARVAAGDPAALQQFDAKVAAAKRVAAATAAWPVRLAADWNKDEFPASPNLVVLETTTVPPPESHLAITLDASTPSPAGPATFGQPQQSVVELEPTLMGPALSCTEACSPSDWNAMSFTVPVAASAASRALTIRDITAPARATSVARSNKPQSPKLDAATMLNVEDAGFDRQPPATTWLLRLDPSFTAADGQTLGYTWMEVIENYREDAFVSFGDGHGVWEKSGGAQLPFYARNFTNVLQWLQKLSPADLMPRIRALEEKHFNLTPAGAGTTRRLTVTPDAIQSHGLDISSVLSPQGTGLAWVAAKPGQTIPRAKAINTDPRSTVVQVTNLGITVKDSPQSTLVFVTRLDNGAAVSGAHVAIVNPDNKEVWTGTTNADGVALSPALPLRKRGASESDLAYLVTAEKDGDVAYVCSNWNEGIEPWNFNVSYSSSENPEILRGSVFTDRGVYKPGEEVHFKAILRHDTAAGIMMLPAGTPLQLTVTDARGNAVEKRAITATRWSSADWTWTVPASATIGNYNVEIAKPKPAKTPGQAEQEFYERDLHASFLVAAYRKPDFRVDVAMKPGGDGMALAGAPLQASLSAKYLFGGVMAKRPVVWSLKREPVQSIPNAITDKFSQDQYAFGYYPERQTESPSNANIAGATVALDPQGALALTLPTEAKTDVAYEYTFEGDVEDVSRQHIASRSAVVLHPAPWYIGLKRPDSFVNAAKGASIEVLAAGLSGVTVPGVAVNVSLLRVQYTSVRRAEGQSFYHWETERKEMPAGEWTITTTSAGLPLTMATPEGGYYEVRAIAKDANGRTARTDLSFYVLGSGYTAWERYDHNRIDLTPEHQTWKPGETARVMIKSPWESATALVTTEREGIRSVRRFALTSTQQTIDVPITEKDIPNIFVSVLLIKGRSAVTAPAKTAATTTSGAQPEIADDPSDPGKPAFRLGYTELFVEDSSKQLGVKVTADHPEYRPAKDAKVNVAVTDKAGNGSVSEVTLWAVDLGVLSLTDYHAPNVRQGVYVQKSLEVLTADSRQRIISRRVTTPKGAGEGGGGGADGGPNGVRKDFRPLAFWLGSVVTDKNGKASTTITLPEALTTYRIMAVAADEVSRFGSGESEIRVTKPLTMLPNFPRFLTLGDKATFGATVTNTTNKAGDAVVTIKSLSPSLTFTTTSRAIRLAAGATEAVRFDAVTAAAGSPRVQMSVKMGGDTDAFEMVLPVQAAARTETTAAFGDTDSTASQPLEIPRGVLTDVGGLDVSLSSTALVGLSESVRYLSDYAYLCTEQRASRALASMLAADLGSSFAIGATTPAAYRAQAETMLKELASAQCEDGAFALWPGRCATRSAYLTSYVLHVMKVGESLGLSVNTNVTNAALDFLEKDLKAPMPKDVQWQPVWSASQAFGVKVLAEYGRNQDSNITRLVGISNRLPVFALSYLADAMAAAKERGPRYQDIVRRITNALRVEGDRAHVEEIDQDALGWLWNSNVRATAIVLDGFTARGDNPTLVPSLVRWLTGARTGGRWGNTQENATALLAFVSYYKKFEATPPNMTARVQLGAATIGTASFEGRSTTAAAPIRVAMKDLLAATAPTALTMSRTGDGRLYFTTRLQYASKDPQPATDQGMRIERQFERFVESGSSPASTSFAAGDLVRVTLRVTLPKEARFVAVTDPMAAGFEAVDGFFRTTAQDLARDASTGDTDSSWMAWMQKGGFDHVEKLDDRVRLFATRLSAGTHEFSYLVRATTGGNFLVGGTWAEMMYAPEVFGRAATATIDIR